MGKIKLRVLGRVAVDYTLALSKEDYQKFNKTFVQFLNGDREIECQKYQK